MKNPSLVAFPSVIDFSFSPEKRKMLQGGLEKQREKENGDVSMFFVDSHRKWLWRENSLRKTHVKFNSNLLQ